MVAEENRRFQAFAVSDFRDWLICDRERQR